MIRGARFCSRQDNRKPSPTDHTVPSGRVAWDAFPRHFMPGYHRKVPSGQNLSNTRPQNRRHSSANLDDEDD